MWSFASVFQCCVAQKASKRQPLHLLLLVEWLSFVPIYPYDQKPIDAVVIFPIFSLVNLFGFGKTLIDNLENMKQEKCWTNNKWKQIHIQNQSVLMQFTYLQYNGGKIYNNTWLYIKYQDLIEV